MIHATAKLRARLAKRALASILACLALGAAAVPAHAATITESSTGSGSRPWFIVPHPDGSLYFTEQGTNEKVRRITTAGAVSDVFDYAHDADEPRELVVAPDGALLVTNYRGFVNRISTGGSLLGTAAQTLANGITTGRLGVGPPTQAWSTGEGADNHLCAHEFDLSSIHCVGSAHGSGIAQGPDGALWWGQTEANRIARTSGESGDVVTTTVALPNPGSTPYQIVAGPDGAMWFTEYDGDRIGRITTGGSISEFPLPSGSGPADITVGPDGALWFTEYDANRIGRITTDGATTHYDVPTPNAAPRGIAVGADGRIWFAEENGGKIGTLDPVDPPPPSTVAAFSYFPSAPCQGNTIDFDASASSSASPIVSYAWSVRAKISRDYQGSMGYWPLVGIGDSKTYGPAIYPNPRQVAAPLTPRIEMSFAQSAYAFKNLYDPETGDHLNWFSMTSYREPVDVTLEVVDSAGRVASTTTRVSFINPEVQGLYRGVVGVYNWGLPPHLPRPECHDRLLFASREARGSGLTLQGKSRLVATLGCPAGKTPCIGSLEARAIGSLSRGSQAAAAKPRRKRARNRNLIGSTGYSIPPGRRTKVKVPLNKTGKKLARRGKLRRVRLTLRSVGPRGKPVSKTKTLRVRRVSKHRKRG